MINAEDQQLHVAPSVPEGWTALTGQTASHQHLLWTYCQPVGRRRSAWDWTPHTEIQEEWTHPPGEDAPTTTSTAMIDVWIINEHPTILERVEKKPPWFSSSLSLYCLQWKRWRIEGWKTERVAQSEMSRCLLVSSGVSHLKLLWNLHTRQNNQLWRWKQGVGVCRDASFTDSTFISKHRHLQRHKRSREDRNSSSQRPVSTRRTEIDMWDWEWDTSSLCSHHSTNTTWVWGSPVIFRQGLMDNHTHSLWTNPESSLSCGDKEQNSRWRLPAYLRPAWAHHQRWRASQYTDSPTVRNN